MSPRPLEAGDTAHLTWGSIRWSVARTMRLGASVELETTGHVPGLYVDVIIGAPVVLTRAQVRSLVPPSRRPANLERWPRWLLRGDDELVVHRRSR